MVKLEMDFYDIAYIFICFEIVLYVGISVIVHLIPTMSSFDTRFGLGLAAFILACFNPYLVIRAIFRIEKREGRKDKLNEREALK